MNKVIIRPADFNTDALAIVDGAKDLISRIDHTHILPKTEEKLIEAIGHMLSLPGVEVTVAEYEGRIVGGLGMIYGPHPWNPDILSAEELFWWTARDAPKITALMLLRSVGRSIKRRGALATFRKMISGPERMEAVYRHIGLKAMETSFIGYF